MIKKWKSMNSITIKFNIKNQYQTKRVTFQISS